MFASYIHIADIRKQLILIQIMTAKKHQFANFTSTGTGIIEGFQIYSK